MPREKQNPVGGPARVFKHSIGDRFGVFEIIGFADNGYYLVRCTRCGDETRKRSNNLAYTKHTSPKGKPRGQTCANCQNKYDVHGQLMTYAEIEEVFGIKTSLILQRRGQRGMSLEEAIFTPVQQQPSPLAGKKLCCDCELFLPATHFSKGQGVCNKCRTVRRQKRESLRRNAVELEQRRAALVDCRVAIETQTHAIAWENKGYHHEFLCLPSFVARFWATDEEGEDTLLLGEADGYLVNEAHALNHGEDIIDLCDCESEELFEVASLLFADELKEQHEFIATGSLLYISEYRPNDTNHDSYLPTAQALYILNATFGPDLLAFGGQFVDLGVYGFTRLPTPNWRPGYGLWFISNEFRHDNFPFPSKERWEEASKKCN